MVFCKKSFSLPERLCERLMDQCGIQCDPGTFQRNKLRKCQSPLGVFVWSLRTADGNVTVGSSWPASMLVERRYLLKAKGRAPGEIEVCLEVNQ